MTSNPLFIVSGPRRGSTLLRYILDTHSQIACPGEINLGILCAHLEAAIRFTRGEPTYFLPLEARAGFAIAETRDIAERIMGSYAAQKGKRIWCEKSIDNLHHLDVLTDVFPDARFICLHRDSLDVVNSCLESSRNGFMEELRPYAVRQPDNLVAAMTSAWVEHTALALDFERDNPERCFRVRYEDLVTAPEASLRPLLAFAGVDWEDGLLAAVFSSRHDQGGGDLKIRFSKRIETSSIGSGQQLNLARIPDEMKAATDALGARLGYPPLAAGRQLPWPAAGTAQAAQTTGATQTAGAAQAAPTDGAAAGQAAAGQAATATDDETPSIRHFVEALLQQRLRERAELAAAIQGSCRLVLRGQGGGDWHLDFTGDVPSVAPVTPGPSVAADSSAGPASADLSAVDCSLIVSVADFKEIIAGRMNPMASFLSGQASVAGDRVLASQIAQLIYSLSRETAA
jgi:protein-tyrosine sulfotransferase